MADNKAKYGLSNVYIAPLTDDGWGKPVHVPGAVNLTLDPSGDSNVVYADDIAYFEQNKNNGYTGEIEFVLFPDQLLIDFLGWYEDEDGKLVEDADATAKKFAMSYQVKGDEKNRRVQLYECQLSRPSKTAATTESTITPQNDTLSLSVTPHYFSTLDKNIVAAVAYQGDTGYDDMHTKVVEPKAAKSA